ncbi:hypothetical protein BKA80DRAFT_269208 [Phyllosticta citrichinensis]
MHLHPSSCTMMAAVASASYYLQNTCDSTTASLYCHHLLRVMKVFMVDSGGKHAKAALGGCFRLGVCGQGLRAKAKAMAIARG